MIIEIDGTPPSLNRFVGRLNVQAYRAAKREWDEIVKLTALSKRPSMPLKRARVHIHYLFPDRRRHDAANMEKFITDGLVLAGIIEDDNFECMVLTLSGEYKKYQRRTIIEITELCE